MFDPKTPPPLGTHIPQPTLADFWWFCGVALCVIAFLWTVAWVLDASAGGGRDGQTWSGPPVFGYGLLFLILAKVSR